MAEDPTGRGQRPASVEFKVTCAAGSAGSRPAQDVDAGANVGPQRQRRGAAPNIIGGMRTRRGRPSRSGSGSRSRHYAHARAGQSRGGVGRVGRDRSGSAGYAAASRRCIDAAAAAASAETVQDAAHAFRRWNVGGVVLRVVIITRSSTSRRRCTHATKG